MLFVRIFFPENYKVDELNNKSPSHRVIRGDFDFRRLERQAIEFFSEGPKVTTLGMWTRKEEDGPMHAYRARDRRSVDFRVPKQNLIRHFDRHGSSFMVVRVICELGNPYWFVMNASSRRAFLLPNHTLNKDGKPVKPHRIRAGRTVH